MKNLALRAEVNFSFRVCFILIFIGALSMAATESTFAGTAENKAGGGTDKGFSVYSTFQDSDDCYGEDEDQENFYTIFHVFPLPEQKRWGARFVDGGEKCDSGADNRGGERGADGVDSMDFDGDCDMDIITGWEESGRVFVYLNPLFSKKPAGGCPQHYLAPNTDLRDNHLIAKQWPFTEITRQDNNDLKPFAGVEDAVFGDNNGDGIADFVVIATEVGREEVFVSIPTPNGSTWNWNTFKLRGADEWNMRALVRDLNEDGCPDIIVGSKSGDPRIPTDPSGSVRWWRCNRDGGGNEWQPHLWKAGLANIWSMDRDGDGRLYDDLPDLWGDDNVIAGDILWVMEMEVVNFVKGNNPHGTKDYKELLITDRKKLSYMYLKDVRDISNRQGWANVVIDNPNNSDEPFLWSDVGQLASNATNGNADPPEIVAAYDDDYDRGVFARWYRCTNWTDAKGCGTAWNQHAWVGAEVIVNPNIDPNHAVLPALPWDPLANKAAALADIDGDGKNEIIATIRGHNFSGVFSLTPQGGSPPECFGNCSSAQKWTYQRIGPYYSEGQGEIKYDNLVLIDADLDCDIDIFSVEENLGDDKGLGVVWYENKLQQSPANAICTQPIVNSLPQIAVSSSLPFIAVNEGSTVTRQVTVTDGDDDVDQGTLTVDHGTLTKNSPGNWTWEYAAGNGPSNLSAIFTATDVRSGVSQKQVDVMIANVAPTILSVTGPGQLNEGSQGVITIDARDPFDQIQYAYDCDGNGSYEIQTSSRQASCLFPGDGVKRVNVRATDGEGGAAFSFVNVTVLNVAPIIVAVNFGGDGGALEGNTYRIIVSFSDPGADPFTCSINYGDGSDPVSVVPVQVGPVYWCQDTTHVYRDNGAFSATVTIGDGIATAQTVAPITVANVPPSVSQPAVNPSTGIDINTPVSASTTFSDPGILDAPFTCTIDFGAGGGFTAGIVSGTNCSSQNPYSYSAAGDYTVTFRVTDKDGGVGTSTRTVTVANLPPVVANPAISIGSVAEGDSIYAASTFTDGGDNGPYSCVVNYGDGTGDQLGTIVLNGPSLKSCRGPFHVYQDNGQYQVRVTVADQDNVSGSNARNVNVSNVAPVVTAAGMTISENGVATVSGTISDPSPLDTFSIVIDWADGSSESFSLPAGSTVYSRTHQYLDDNPSSTPSDTVIAVVQVTDDDGGVGAEGASVTINNIAPVAAINSITDSFGNLVGPVPPNQVAVLLEDLGLTVSASFSDVGTLDTHITSIDWGDGSLWSGAVASPITHTHTYADPGDYLITLTVTDDDNGVSTATRAVKVVSVAGALADVIEQLQAALNDPDLDPQIRTLIQHALNELAGQAGGTGNNGALSLLQAGAWTAMLVKVENAVADLEEAGMDGLASQLVIAVKALLTGLADECAARARTSREHAAVAQARLLIASGDAALTLAGKLQAYRNALLALRPLLPN